MKMPSPNLPDAAWVAISEGANVVRVVRQSQGLSKRDLADRAGLPLAVVNGAEADDWPLGIDRSEAMARIADALGVSVELLSAEN